MSGYRIDPLETPEDRRKTGEESGIANPDKVRVEVDRILTIGERRKAFDELRDMTAEMGT